jgi:hypothetical protein
VEMLFVSFFHFDGQLFLFFFSFWCNWLNCYVVSIDLFLRFLLDSVRLLRLKLTESKAF